MALTDIAGHGGNFAAPAGFNGAFRSWSLTIDTDTARYATFSSKWKKSKLCASGATGSVEAVVQRSAATTKPLPAAGSVITLASFSGACTFTADAGCTYAGTFNFTSVTFSRSPDGEMTMTANVESDGAVTQTWAEA